MPKYCVTRKDNYTRHSTVTVEAEDEESAIEAAGEITEGWEFQHEDEDHLCHHCSNPEYEAEED